MEEVYLQPLKAYRAWHIVLRNGLYYLASLNSTVIWLYHEEIKFQHMPQCPYFTLTPECNCGIYSYKYPINNLPIFSTINGEVFIWGKILKYQRGYKSTYAYPSCLYLSPNNICYICGKIFDTTTMTVEKNPYNDIIKFCCPAHSSIGNIPFLTLITILSRQYGLPQKADNTSRV